MRSGIYTWLATLGFVAMFWLYDVISAPGTQWLAAFGLGVVAALTVRAIVRVVRVEDVEKREFRKTIREALRDGR